MSSDAAYYRADAQGLNPGDATTRTLGPLDGKEYTYATTRLDVARSMAARHADFSVYLITLEEPVEADPGAAQDDLGQLFVRSPWGAVVHPVDGNQNITTVAGRKNLQPPSPRSLRRWPFPRQAARSLISSTISLSMKRPDNSAHKRFSDHTILAVRSSPPKARRSIDPRTSPSSPKFAIAAIGFLTSSPSDGGGFSRAGACRCRAVSVLITASSVSPVLLRLRRSALSLACAAGVCVSAASPITYPEPGRWRASWPARRCCGSRYHSPRSGLCAVEPGNGGAKPRAAMAQIGCRGDQAAVSDRVVRDNDRWPATNR